MSELSISFEFQPPYSPDAARRLEGAAQRLTAFAHDFSIMHWGAGAVPADRALKAIKSLKKICHTKIVAHFAQNSMKKSDITNFAQRYNACDIDHIYLTRSFSHYGRAFQQHEMQYKNILDMMRDLKNVADFNFIVSVFPESKFFDVQNIDYIKRAIDAGARHVISHICYNNDHILALRDKLVQNNIHIPLRVGIMPLTKIKKTYNLVRQYGISVQDAHAKTLFEMTEDQEDKFAIDGLAAHYALLQCQELIQEGITDFHFLTQNLYQSVYIICKALNVKRQYPHRAEHIDTVSLSA
ncbi:MAG: methylenetetrahydrofolate reductase [Pseudomonadota bacterium]